MQSIKNTCTVIEKNKSHYSIKKTEDTVTSTEGNEIVGYYQQNIPQLVLAKYYGETGKIIQSYYFKNGALIQAVCKSFFYNKPIYDHAFKLTKCRVSTSRYFFYDDSLINQKGAEKDVANQLLVDSKRLLGLLK